MNALVTGSAGFIGSHLVEALRAGGADVRCMDEKEGLPIQDCNLPMSLDGVTHVFHLAGIPGVRDSWGSKFQDYLYGNVDATQILLEACKGKNIEKFVYASSSSVYGNRTIPLRETETPHPISPYGVTKLAAEHLCYAYHVNYNIPTVSLRYFTVYGPRQRSDMAFYRFLKAAIADKPLTLYGTGMQKRDFTFVTDTVDATIRAAYYGVPGKVYNVGGGSHVSVNTVLSLIKDLVGRQLNIHHLDTVPGDVEDTCAEMSVTRSDLNFIPQVSLERGLKAEYEWLLDVVDT